MYIIIATLIILIIIFFFQNIITIIIKIFTNPSSFEQIGNMWFVGLLLVNFAVIAFIFVFYYYKSSIPGSKGAQGLRGFPGIPGNDCTMPGGCGNNFEP